MDRVEHPAQHQNELRSANLWFVVDMQLCLQLVHNNAIFFGMAPLRDRSNVSVQKRLGRSIRLPYPAKCRSRVIAFVIHPVN